MRPRASVLIPTRSRPDYLDVTLGSIMPQAREAGAEVIVISDGPDTGTAGVAARHGATLVSLPEPRCLNAARNAGIAAAQSELNVFVDDDVVAPEGWLGELLRRVEESPDVGVFGGPIRPLQGGGPRSCGREPAPITALDLGAEDLDADHVWGANMAIRRGAFDQVGAFDESLQGRGDEEEWLRRYAQLGGRVRYLAAAGLHHRRAVKDATIVRMSRAAYGLGRTARRNDVRKGTPKPPRAELRILAACAWHTARRRCGYGAVLFAHTAGRVHEALSPAQRTAGGDDFLSGTSGQVTGIRATGRAAALDAAAALTDVALRRPTRLRTDAQRAPRRRVLVLGIERTQDLNLMAAARAELERSHHEVVIATRAVGELGKFENLDTLLAEHPAAGHDWLVVIDDDVALPPGFLDTFVFLAERFDLRIAQPAHRRRSHAAWTVTRRRALSVVRETAFVEIGPLTAFHRSTFEALLPFPPLRAGLDAHWAAIARDRGWRIGIIDATPIAHALRPVAASYDRAAAIEEARTFLKDRPYVISTEAQRTLATHRSW